MKPAAVLLGACALLPLLAEVKPGVNETRGMTG